MSAATKQGDILDMGEIEPTKAARVAVQSVNTNAGGLLNIIAEAARDPSFDLDRMRVLFDMQKEVLAEEAKRAYMTAMSLAQSEMGQITKDAVNVHTKSKYARLEAIDRAIRPLYTKHGISLSFDQSDSAAGEAAVTCTVSHIGGHEKKFSLNGKLDAAGTNGTANKTGIQALGSTVTYLRRYLTCMIFNIAIADEDKDGNAPQRDERGITESQAEELRKLIDETSVDLAVFCGHYGIEKLGDLPRSEYANARGRLIQRKERAGA